MPSSDELIREVAVAVWWLKDQTRPLPKTPAADLEKLIVKRLEARDSKALRRWLDRIRAAMAVVILREEIKWRQEPIYGWEKP